MTVPEQWRPIPGWEGLYEASDQGQIRSLTRVITDVGGWTRVIRGRVLARALVREATRYSVQLHINGTATTYYVAALVLRAFRGLPPDGMECCHNDGDSLNDRLDNLRWDTHAENMLDRVRHNAMRREAALRPSPPPKPLQRWTHWSTGAPIAN